ncbi:PAS domain-containing sensor histidine kinase [Aquabacterium sp. A7-Y]|uniref:sensor histidine kinase n=1 Tax=Aquabacterium sp. A7-Y TaxID=1349605 RepID=UPI00223DE099|nr:PAS domain-containing sensor histidine kinase [Aquabacterium sp. A7-Y]MCW7541632.1 PAS domain-containing sensor histidine kinase [Aquabacterium sp. A7-Y]
MLARRLASTASPAAPPAPGPVTPWADSILWRQLRGLLLAGLAAAVVLSLMQVLAHGRVERAELDSSLRQALDGAMGPARQAAYELNPELAEVVVAGLWASQRYASVEILDDEGRPLASARGAVKPLVFGRLLPVLLGPIERQERVLMDPRGSQQVGRLLVQLDLRAVESDVIERLVAALLQSLLMLAVLIAVVAAIFYFTITRPLVQAAHTLSVSDEGSSLQPPRGHERSEIGALFAQFRHHIERVRAAEALAQQAARDLAANEARVSALIESLLEGIVTLDADNRVLSVNPAAAQLFGLSPAAAVGRPLADLLPDLAAGEPPTPPIYGPARQAPGGSQHGMTRALRADGGSLVVELSDTRSNAHGQALRVLLLRDVSDWLALEEARRERAAAEAADRAKTAFLSRMSHELRTPLNAILGFSQLLLLDTGKTLTEAQRKHATLIHDAGQHLLSLIRDLLDKSLIEAGRLQVDLKPVPLAPLVAECLPLIGSLAEQKSVQVDVQALQEPGLAVVADATRLRQSLVNLLTNAIKYNRPHGKVEVAVQRREPGRVTVSVQDNGVGVSPERLSQVFEPFNRLGQENGPIEGVGLGLALTRQLVGMMNGTLDFQSEPGRGTVVSITLPLARADT